MGRLHHIQALRGLAATLVVLDHTLASLIKYGALPNKYESFFFHLGDAGVEIFFVISGFIMMRMSYAQFGTSAAASDFAVKRLIRIVPTYWIATLLATLFFVAFQRGHVHAFDVLRSFLFIPYLDQTGLMRPVLGQGWTLNFEMFFYLIFTVALLFPRRLGVGLMSAIFLGVVMVGQFAPASLDFLAPAVSLRSLTEPLVLLFLLGAWLGIVATVWPSLISVKWPILSVLFFLGINFVFFNLADGSTPVFVQHGVYWLCGVACVAMCVFTKESVGGRFEAFAEKLGDASYSTYLFHTFVLAVLNRLITHHSLVLVVLYMVVAVVGSNALGYAMNVMVERPTMRWLRQRILYPAAAAA